jgi:hypothetical protein
MDDSQNVRIPFSRNVDYGEKGEGGAEGGDGSIFRV